jgi:hypothetical protein
MILLSRDYKGYTAGSTVQLQSSEEAALVAQNYATVSASATTTTGAATANLVQGRATIAAGASSVVITNALIDATSKVYAVVAQAAADGTLLRVERILCAAGSFTIYGTANATASTAIDWVVLNPSGLTQTH